MKQLLKKLDGTISLEVVKAILLLIVLIVIFRWQTNRDIIVTHSFASTIDNDLLAMSIMMIFTLLLIFNLFLRQLRFLIYEFTERANKRILMTNLFERKSFWVKKLFSIRNTIVKGLNTIQIIGFGYYDEGSLLNLLTKSNKLKITKHSIIAIAEIVIFVFISFYRELIIVYKNYIQEYANNLFKEGIVFLQGNWEGVLFAVVIIIACVKICTTNRYEKVVINSQEKELNEILEAHKKVQIILRELIPLAEKRLKETMIICEKNNLIVSALIEKAYGNIQYSSQKRTYEESQRNGFYRHMDNFLSDIKRECTNKEGKYEDLIESLRTVIASYYDKSPFYNLATIREIGMKCRFSTIYLNMDKNIHIAKKFEEIAKKCELCEQAEKFICRYKERDYVDIGDIDAKCKSATNCFRETVDYICDNWLSSLDFLIEIDEYRKAFKQMYELKAKDISMIVEYTKGMKK